MARRRSTRPSPPRRFSSHLRRHGTGASSPRDQSGYGAMGANVNHRNHRSNSELEHLLEEQHEEEEHADSDGLYPPHCSWTADQINPVGKDLYGHRDWPVYDNIHRIRHEIVNSIDDPYSLDQLKAPRMNITLIRPLVDQFSKGSEDRTQEDLSIIYCLLVNRTQFIREQSYATHHQTVNLTRALVCEIVAEKILRRFNEHNPGPKGLLKLANILVAGFDPFQNAPEEVIKNNEHFVDYVRNRNGRTDRTMTALEVAIVSESKSFLASSACQRVVDAIYRGKLVYTPNSFIDMLPDYWKKRPISLYDPRRGPLLNQYRLAVPRTRNVIEIGQFLILIILYLFVMEGRETRATVEYTLLEGIFSLYAWGWILDQVASMLEHGWTVYTQNLWSFLDVAFSCLFAFYFVVRMIALVHDDPNDPDGAEEMARLALDALSCAAPVLIPRLAFNIFSENLVFLCLRDMLANFVTLVLLASWCFIGFLLSLKWLHNGLHQPITIGKWMIWIWFGLDGTGIERAPDFHWLLGPTVMITFAFLGNTLFVTILVSMLSNTFGNISSNAVQEMQYRRSVLTFEGVKADALFSFMPPINLVALFVLLPLKFVLSPRWFHKVKVFTVKLINAPILVAISLYERRTLWISSKYRQPRPKEIDWRSPYGPSARFFGMGWWGRTFQFWDLSRFSAHGDVAAVFDEAPGRKAVDDARDEGIGASLKENFLGQFNPKKKEKTGQNSTSKPKTPEGSIGNLQKSTARSSATATLKQQFATDSEDGDNDSEEDGKGNVPKGYHKMRKGIRKDSILDFHAENPDLTEANARLQRLEESVSKIEGLLIQLLNNDQPDSQVLGGDDLEADDASPGS